MFALTAATNTGMAGVYGFAITINLAIVVFMGWSDVRARFPGKRSSRAVHSSNHGRAENRRRPTRSS